MIRQEEQTIYIYLLWSSEVDGTVECLLNKSLSHFDVLSLYQDTPTGVY